MTVIADRAEALTGLGVTRDWGRFVLGPIDVRLPLGEVLGLVGPNGSGKTTLIKAILGLIRADQGDITVLGRPPGERQGRVGAVLDTAHLVPDWTVEQCCAALRTFYPAWDPELARTLLDRFGIPVAAKVRELSRGETSKLLLTLALSHRPELLVLDEPTSGLDPLAREEVLTMVRDFMTDEHHSVLFSTHIPSDLATVADRIHILREGQTVHEGPMDQLTERYFAVRGVVEDLQRNGGQLIGTRTTATNFTAIVPAESTAGLPPRMIVEQATVDDIVKALAVPTEGRPA